MAFRIKSKYSFNSIEHNDFPYFTFLDCDDTCLLNKLNNNKISIQADRIKFSNIFNVIDQHLSILKKNENEEIIEKKTFSIVKGKYDVEKLNNLLNSFDKRISFIFKKETNSFRGDFTLKNNTQDNDFIIEINKNLLLITGLIDILNISNTKEKYVFLPLPMEYSLKGNFDISRPISEIKLYSKYIFDYKTEICYKSFSHKELNFLIENNALFGTEIKTCTLNSKLFKVDRFDMENVCFYFVDFFDEPVYFEFCEIVIFLLNKC